MASEARFFLRIPLVLLAVGDLGLLAARLRPWPEVPNLPDQGAAGYDPMICLLVYASLLFWVSSSHRPSFQRTLTAATGLAIPAGLLAIVTVLLSERPPSAVMFFSRFAILLVASLFWGWAGVRAEELTGSPQIAIMAGLWSAMISVLMAVAVLLARVAEPYTHLLPGDPAVDALIRALHRATGLLLVAPLVGGMMGLFFASVSIHREEKKMQEEEARRVLETRR